MTAAKGWTVVAVAAALLIGYFAWDLYLSPEAQIRRTLGGAADAAEAADADGFLSFLSGDYRDYLHADRAMIGARVREAFGKIDRLNVTLQNIEVAVAGDEATARFDLVLVAIRGDERYVVLGTPFQPEKVTAHLRREEAEGWKVSAVERRPLD